MSGAGPCCRIGKPWGGLRYSDEGILEGGLQSTPALPLSLEVWGPSSQPTSAPTCPLTPAMRCSCGGGACEGQGPAAGLGGSDGDVLEGAMYTHLEPSTAAQCGGFGAMLLAHMRLMRVIQPIDPEP